MGGLFSSSPGKSLSVDVVNEVVNKSILDFRPSTSSSQTASLTTSFTDSTVTDSTFNQNAELKIYLEQLITASQTSDFKQKIDNDIKQELESKSVAFLSDLAGFLTNKDVSISTKLGASIKNLHLTEITPICAGSQNVNLVIEVLRSKLTGVTVNQNIVLDITQKCQSNISTTMGTVSDMTNTVNQKAKITEENPLDFLNKLADTLIWPVLIIVLIVAGILVVYKLFFSKPQGNQQAQQVQAQQEPLYIAQQYLTDGTYPSTQTMLSAAPSIITTANPRALAMRGLTRGRFK